MYTVRNVWFCGVALAACAAACAQTVVVPEKAVPDKPLDSMHLTERPYSADLPKPIFPSSARVQKEFVVRYIYDYAVSNYTPQVTLPVVPRAQVDRTTPEGAMIAMLSAMQIGDYDGWLQCWDDDSRKVFVDAAKNGKQDAAFWKKQWQAGIAGRSIVLVDRLEMVGYVVLDARLTKGGRPESALFPSIFRNVKGQWYATNSLEASTMLGNYRPGVAGIDSHVSPEPMAKLTGPAAQEGDAQAEFFHYHALLPAVTRAAK